MAREALGLLAQGAVKRVIGGGRPQELAFLGAFGPEDLDLAHVAQRKPAPQRDDRGRPAGKLGQDVCAFRIAWPTLARDARCERRDGAEFLLHEPSRLVELMYAHVDEYSAAVGAKVGTRRLAVPLEVGHRVDLAQLASRDAVAQLD